MLIYLRFFLYGFIVFSVTTYLFSPDIVAIYMGLIGGASTAISCAVTLLLIKTYKDLLKT